MRLVDFFRAMIAAEGAQQGVVAPPTPVAPNAHLWLHQPYYAQPPQAFVPTGITDPITGKPIVTNSGPASTVTLTVESYLQSMLESTMSYIQGYLNPAFQTGVAVRTAQAIIDNYVATAKQRVVVYPDTTAGADPTALGNQYGNLQVSLMQQIDSGQYGGTPGVSVFDAWTAMGA